MICQFTKNIVLGSANKLNYSLILVLVFTFINQGCTISYSTSGASIPPEAETVSIQYFPNNARSQIISPTLSQDFTNALKDKFTSRTSLALVNGVGDLIFEGEIWDYTTKPQDITGDEYASMMRLTITVRVKYTNTLDPKFDFDEKFSRFADYSADKDLESVAPALHEKIIEELIEDIFNKSVVNW